MSVYKIRDRPAYRIDALSSPGDEKNTYILKWWTPAHDEAIMRAIERWQWHWFWHIRDKIVSITPAAILEAWKKDDPACRKRAWYNVLIYFSHARAGACGFDKLIRTPLVKNCLLCQLTFQEDSLPAPLVDRLGIDGIDFCTPCLAETLLRSGNDLASAESIRSYLCDLTEALKRVPPSDFGRDTGDFFGMTSGERLAVFKVLMLKPSTKRVKDIYGSWLNALIQAKVLEDDVRRTLRGTQCVANDGHVCLSLGEKTVDDLLFSLGIQHEKEPKYPDSNFRADFRVRNIFIEYFGLAGDASYDARAKEKVEICFKNGIKLIAIYPKDLSSVHSLKAKILKEISPQ